MGRNMEDDYLKLFGNMFYNIKEDQDNKKIIEEASEVLASIIIKYGELINEITARTSAQDEFVDTVICLFFRKIMEQLDALNSYRCRSFFTDASDERFLHLFHQA